MIGKIEKNYSLDKCTIDDKRIIGATSLCVIFTWIDATYEVHNDMRSQTGRVMFMRHGVVKVENKN